VVEPAARRRRHRAGSDGAALGITQALERLLTDRSIHDVTVNDIIDEADIARGTFYFWFTSKYDVVAHAHRAISTQILEAADPWWSNPASPPELVVPVLEGFGATYRAHAPILNATSETWHLDPEVRASWDEMMGALITNVEGLIRAQQERGIARSSIDARLTAEALVWMNERTLHIAYLSGGRAAIDSRLISNLARIWTATLYPLPVGDADDPRRTGRRNRA
jgi:AcrR family transcriptional regulator